MRTPLLTSSFALLLVLAGCLGDSGSDGDLADGADPEAQAPATPPEPLHWETDIVAGADPFNVAGTFPACSQDVSSCDYYEFTTNGTFGLTATLAWGIAANDLDLYLYQGSDLVSQDGINGIPPAASVPATSQVMHVDSLQPGTYTFWVVIWNGAADAYTLDAAFA